MSSMQPCWFCTKFCGGCAWSKKNPQPIEGWDATPTVKHSTGNSPSMESYEIHYCPEFESDGTSEEVINHNKVIISRFDGGKLRRLLSERHMTQQQLGQIIGTNTVTVCRYIKNQIKPKEDTKRRIASALHMDYKEFVEETTIGE